MCPSAATLAFTSETHPGETLDHARSSSRVHCTRTGLLVNLERIAAAPSAPSPPKVVRPYWPECSSPRTPTLSAGTLRVFAICMRKPCDCDECVQTVTLPSRRASATATKGPMGACLTYGCSYVAEMVFGAPAGAALTSAALPLLSVAAPHLCSRIAFVRLSLPGSPAQSVHFVPAATESAALIASHSLGETTATRLAFLTTSAVGNCFLSSAPTEIKVEPIVAGSTMRACNMPGKVTSQLHCVLPVALSGIPGMGYDVPTILSWFTCFIGGSPVTEYPSSPATPVSSSGSIFRG